jgi:hypothetical protein
MSIAHTTLRELVAALARCQRALAAGDLDTASRAVEAALAIDGENVQARDLLRQIEQAPQVAATPARSASRPRTPRHEPLRSRARSESPAGGDRVPHGVVPMGSWVAFEQRVRQRRVERLVTEAHEAARDGRHEHAERALEELGRLAPADERVAQLQQAVREGSDAVARAGDIDAADRHDAGVRAFDSRACRGSPASTSAAPVLADVPPIVPDVQLDTPASAPVRSDGSHARRRTAATGLVAAAVLIAAVLGGMTAYWHLAPEDTASDAEQQAAVVTSSDTAGEAVAPGGLAAKPLAVDDGASLAQPPAAAEATAPGAVPAGAPASPPAPPPSSPQAGAAVAARSQGRDQRAPAATSGTSETGEQPARPAAATPPASARPTAEPVAPAPARRQAAEARPTEPSPSARDTGPAASPPAGPSAPPALARVAPPPAPPVAAPPQPLPAPPADVPLGTAGAETPAPVAAADPAGAPVGVDRSIVRTPPAAGLDVAARTAVDEYRQAFNSLDAMAAQRVWPTVDRRALDRAFRQLATQSISFDRCEVTTAGVAGKAVCNGRATWAPTVGDRTPRDEARTWRFTLAQRGSRWVITDAAVERR